MRIKLTLCIRENWWSDLGSGWFDYGVTPICLSTIKKSAVSDLHPDLLRSPILTVFISWSVRAAPVTGINGKESRIGLGAYPAVSLSEARQQRESIRRMLAQNINPAQQRAAERGLRSPEKVFKTVALAWHQSNKKWSQNTAYRLLASMNNHIFPVIGHLSVTELKPRHFIDLLKGIEAKGLLEVASRTRQHLCNFVRVCFIAQIALRRRQYSHACP